MLDMQSLATEHIYTPSLNWSQNFGLFSKFNPRTLTNFNKLNICFLILRTLLHILLNIKIYLHSKLYVCGIDFSQIIIGNI